MNNETKQKINQRYERELNRGERFWPDSIYKDAIMALGIFLVLVLLATFIGIPSDPKADPSDTSYVPRPEWYFLFLFQALKYFPGELEAVAAVILPGVAMLYLILAPLLDRGPKRHPLDRPFWTGTMVLGLVGMAYLTWSGARAPLTNPLAAASP